MRRSMLSGEKSEELETSSAPVFEIDTMFSNTLYFLSSSNLVCASVSGPQLLQLLDDGEQSVDRARMQLDHAIRKSPIILAPGKAAKVRFAPPVADMGEMRSLGPACVVAGGQEFFAALQIRHGYPVSRGDDGG